MWYTDENRGMIQHRDRARQIIDFSGLKYGRNNRITPTDVDGLIEYEDNAYILIEIKHKGASVPTGQRLAIERMIRDLAPAKGRKKAIALICEHDVDDCADDIIAADCLVRKVYMSDCLKWENGDGEKTLKFVVDDFIKWVDRWADRQAVAHG